MLCDWPAVSENLALAITFARRFLDSSPEERAIALDAPEFGSRMAWELALAICQAREIVRLLEEVEEAWNSAMLERMKKN